MPQLVVEISELMHYNGLLRETLVPETTYDALNSVKMQNYLPI